MSLRTGIATAATAALAATVLAGTGATAATADDGTPTFPEYKSSAYVDSDDQYIVNGDEPLASTGDLRQYYDQMTRERKTGTTLEEGLIVNTVNGRDDVWASSRVGDLTFCVSDRFRNDKAAVLAAMESGAGLWEDAAPAIDFRHVAAADSRCTVRNNDVVFSVEPTKTTQYIARAFFPSSTDRQRNILVNPTSLQSSGSWTPSNIMGHELGHTLGLRHEHTRPEAGTCFEDTNWRPLTAYDSSSIMHYPQCNGSSDDLSMTSLDRQGIAALYGG